ncbi:MAG: hypothetical protein Q8M08_01580 [Bacteroidales bacterium]|nr:hypothetical protein [Bacteroidales bacterium]
MKILLMYLFESTICVSALYSIYWFFLKRDTFFQMNRFYLLSMVLFSFLIPLMPFHWTPTGPSASMLILLEPALITPAKVEQSMLKQSWHKKACRPSLNMNGSTSGSSIVSI